MDADTFTEKLWGCAPPLERLLSVGLDRAEAEAFRARHRAQRKERSTAFSDDVLIDLVSRYEIGLLEIGLIHFDGEMSRSADWQQVAYAEADLLVINKVTAEIEVRDLADESVTLWMCASDSSSFLSAILRAACFLSRASYDLTLADDELVRCKEAIECSALAGGNRYYAFYKVLLGCDL